VCQRVCTYRLWLWHAFSNRSAWFDCNTALLSLDHLLEVRSHGKSCFLPNTTNSVWTLTIAVKHAQRGSQYSICILVIAFFVYLGWDVVMRSGGHVIMWCSSVYSSNGYFKWPKDHAESVLDFTDSVSVWNSCYGKALMESLYIYQEGRTTPYWNH